MVKRINVKLEDALKLNHWLQATEDGVETLKVIIYGSIFSFLKFITIWKSNFMGK
jgi:hypothetical protein